MILESRPREYRARTLSAGKVSQAYALIQAAAPGVSLERWRAFCESLGKVGAHDQGAAVVSAGVIAIEDSEGYVRGLFSYHCAPDLMHGCTLTVADVVILDLFDSETVATVLFEAIDVLARSLGCTGIHAQVAADAQGLMERFQSRGMRVEAMVLCLSEQPLSRRGG